MIESLRRAFNDAWTPETYARFQALLAERCGETPAFRCSETPVFLTKAELGRMVDAAIALTEQAIASDDAQAAAEARLPAAYRAAGDAPRPTFVQADFGIDAHGDPKLVEIQGFPSLYAFQPVLGETYKDAFDLAPDLDPLLGGLDRAGYDALLRATLCGDADPAETVLLELFPDRQKTRPDFTLTQRRWGVRTVCATQVTQSGRRLIAPDGTPIRRLYNRLIVDELDRTGVTLPFDWSGDLEVEWVGHPNWYFRLSKCTLPFLRHETAPEAHFLSDVSKIPSDLEDWVLKPLFSFAGRGVVVGPTRAEVDAVDDRANWLLQRRVNFVPTIDTPEGPTRVEVRIMLVDTPAGLQPVAALLRLGRGKLLGVDQNRDATWVGASAALAV